MRSCDKFACASSRYQPHPDLDRIKRQLGEKA
jgi:hypothetical protein